MSDWNLITAKKAKADTDKVNNNRISGIQMLVGEEIARNISKGMYWCSVNCNDINYDDTIKISRWLEGLGYRTKIAESYNDLYLEIFWDEA